MAVTKSEERDAAILKAYVEGGTYASVGRQFGVAASTIAHILHAAGHLSRVPKNYEPTPEELTKLRKMRLDGFAREAITRAMKWSESKLDYVLRVHGAPLGKMGAARRSGLVVAAPPKPKPVPAAPEPEPVVETGPVVFTSASGIRAVREAGFITLPYVSVIHGDLLPAMDRSAGYSPSPR